MLRETFIGHNPSHFVSGSIVRAFVISEVFLWSSWFGILPLLGVFVLSSVKGGSLQLAASGYSVYLIARVIFELLSGKFMTGTTDRVKIYVSMFGLFFAGIGVMGFAFSTTIPILFLAFIITGFGIGLASPPKNALFSSHLDKNKATTEWGIYDAVVFICIALSTALGGFIATAYGFKIFFIIAGFWTLLSIIPYVIYLKSSD